MTIWTRWPDNQKTSWSGDHIDHMIKSPDGHIDQMIRWHYWPDDQMTRWPDDQMTRWPYWPYCIETSSKTTVTHCSQKCDQSPQNWDVISHTRYNDDMWWSDHTDVKKTSLKTTVTHCSQKRDQSPQNWDVISHTRYNDDIWWSDHTDV